MNKIPPFSISKPAIEEIQVILKDKNIPSEYGLRVGIKGGGGCGGVSFLIGFDKMKEGDDMFQIEGITVYMEKKHAMFLAGKEIDFTDEASGRGFVFN